MTPFKDIFNDQSFTFQYVQGTYKNKPLNINRTQFMLAVLYAPRPIPLWLNDPFAKALGVQLLHMTLEDAFDTPQGPCHPVVYNKSSSRVFMRDPQHHDTFRATDSKDAIRLLRDGEILTIGPVTSDRFFRKAYGKYILKTTDSPSNTENCYHGDLDFLTKHGKCSNDISHRNYRQQSYGLVARP